MFLQDFMAKNRFLHFLARFYTLKKAKNWNQSLSVVYGSIILEKNLVAQVTYTHQWFDRQNYRQQKCFFGTPYCTLVSGTEMWEDYSDVTICYSQNIFPQNFVTACLFRKPSRVFEYFEKTASWEFEGTEAWQNFRWGSGKEGNGIGLLWLDNL